MIPEENLQEIRNYLQRSENPLFFFDDDADGVCSYILLKKYCNKGEGFIFKSLPILDSNFYHKVEQESPDLVLVLDIAVVEQDFIDKCNVPVIWIDHHAPLKRKGIHYYNPKLWNKNDVSSTTYWCYKITKFEKDLWIATLGSIADWTIPDFANEFSKKYPDLLPKNIKSPPKAIFETKLGFLIKMLSLNLKGKSSEIRKSLNALAKIESPYEILNQTSEYGKLIYKNAEKPLREYNKILEDAISGVDKDKFLIYIYPDKKMSFTSELSNELLYKYPDKIIIVGREKGDEVKLSFRSTRDSLPDKLEKSVQGLNGRFGGHTHACGGSIKIKDFDVLIENFKKQFY